MFGRIITFLIALLFLLPNYRLKSHDLSKNELCYSENFEIELDVIIENIGSNKFNKTKRCLAPHFDLLQNNLLSALSNPCYRYRILFSQLYIPISSKHVPWSKSSYL